MGVDHDFVIVGAGTAGCVLAARLSEDPGVRVLLMEAGAAEPDPRSAIPPAWPLLQDTASDWGDLTVPQLSGAPVNLPRGRGLGGSSAINAMVFTRGHRSAYDRWGVKGWGFDDLLPYFGRSERALSVGPATPAHPWATAFLEASAQAGHPLAADISGGTEFGFGRTDVTIAGGRRISSADAYLTPAAQRANLEIITDAQVRRILFDDTRAVGVSFRTNGIDRQVRCEREIILAAGAIGSPHLLMLSGVGPAGHLRDLDIDVVADRPGVGSNLHDHVVTILVYEAAQETPPAVNGHVDIIGLAASTGDLPDLQLFSFDVPLVPEGVLEHGYTIGISAMAPYSRGTVRLRSADPRTLPSVDPAYYRDPRDLDTMAIGLAMGREIGRQPALSVWRKREVTPGPDTRDDRAVREYLLASTHPYYHPVGTCRMGADNDAVVDSELRVHGLDGLRVVDASIMPTITSGNTAAPVYGIAERAAELIR
ncbi:GMC family oxidoreductase [Kutzneria sp. 744]|uniref:GMC family oxidoreductase n=1 Tax=Kutzneria sp. (strain 744) TaxID=345341 RepID=UPI0005BE1CF8|nr:GMC family oxidoreductase N-terminal domain-containing protein [Kutzneria sp. 744]